MDLGEFRQAIEDAREDRTLDADIERLCDSYDAGILKPRAFSEAVRERVLISVRRRRMLDAG